MNEGEIRVERRPGAAPPPADMCDLLRPLPAGAALLIDARGIVRACGPALPAFLGASEGFLNDYVGQLPPAALGDCLARLWCECQRTGEPATSEVVLCCDRPREADALSLSLRVSRHPEAAAFYVITLRDLSRERGRVQALLDHIDTLERRARRADAAAETAAHDIRSCLGALSGFLDLALRRQELPLAVTDDLHRAREVARRVAAIAARAEACVDEPLPGVPVGLGPLGHHLFRALGAAHPEVEFTWCVQAEDLRSGVRSDVLWEILWNLLSNAVKYGRADRALHVELRAWLDQGEICVEVRDNGRGVPAGEEEAVFARGCRGSNVGDSPGSGLGLFSARRLLEQQGGRIWAEPSYEGATIRLTIPGWITRSPAGPGPTKLTPSRSDG